MDNQQCESCATQLANTESPSHLSGLYVLACLSCAIRLVKSARPSRLHQEAMLAAIARSRNAPSRESILAGIKRGGNDNREVDAFALQP